MIEHLDISTIKSCINIYSYGEICICCGCCEREKDIIKRLKNQIKYYTERIEENKNFQYWDDDEKIRKMQEENVKKNDAYYRNKIKEIAEQLNEKKQ